MFFIWEEVMRQMPWSAESCYFAGTGLGPHWAEKILQKEFCSRWFQNLKMSSIRSYCRHSDKVQNITLFASQPDMSASEIV